jgi:NAD-dependent dihydropyrimidine dehydrogenase PreA subunit
MVIVKVDLEKCTACGTCVDTCPVSVYELKDKLGKKISEPVNQEQCIVCHACEVQCPQNAITIIE